MQETFTSRCPVCPTHTPFSSWFLLLAMLLVSTLMLSACSTESVTQSESAPGDALPVTAADEPTSGDALPVTAADEPTPVSQAADASSMTPIAGAATRESVRILHIMSYHSGWEWTHDQLAGFKDALDVLDVEYRVIEMDTKRNNSEEWIEQVSQEAHDTIDTWKPDLIYLTDDAAQEHVARDYVNTNIPIVFSGVNAEPSAYGYVGSSNVTGVLEREQISQTLQLLQRVAPDVRKIAVIADDDLTWVGVSQRLKETARAQFPELEIIDEGSIQTFEEYKRRVVNYQTAVDAIASVGIFTFKDEQGDNVPFADVLHWTVENSDLPDFSFWRDRVANGTLLVVTTTGYEQGYTAGEKARQILVKGVSPADIEIQSVFKGRPMINLARARKLGLTIDSTLLLAVDVFQTYEWEE